MKERAELRIEALTPGGDGIARPPDGPVVFVEGAAPGELVLAELDPARRGFRRARILEVLEPSPGRREPPCPEAGRCGGCGWQHLDEEAQARALEDVLRQALRRTGGFAEGDVEVEPARGAGEPLGYRRRARFLLDLAASPPRLGFRRRRSHAVHAVPACPVLEPELDDLREALAGTAPELARLLPGLRRAELGLDRVAAGRATACLVLPERVPAAAREAAAETLAGASPELAAVEVRDPAGIARIGPARLPYRRGPAGEPERWPARHAPGGFLQASRAGNALLVERVLAACSPRPGLGVLELFAGSGNFTLPLAAAGASVTAVEESAPALECCREALDEAGLDAELVAGDAAAVVAGLAAEGRRFDLVLLDPPRTGAKDCARALASLEPARIVSVSCDAATFARDAALLREAGYELRSAEPLVLFPQTPHLEIVGRLERG